MAKYIPNGAREVIKTTKLYHDGKTQVPKEVIDLLKLQRGSQMVWVRIGTLICIESPKRS